MSERARAGVRVRLLIDALGGRLIEKRRWSTRWTGPACRSSGSASRCSSRRSSPTTACTARSASWTGGSRSPAGSASPRSGAATPATRTSGATPTCGSRARRSTGCSRRSSRTGPRPAGRSTTSDDEFPEQPQTGSSHGAGRPRLGEPRLGRHAVGLPRHARLGAGAAADRHGVLRPRRRLPRHPLRRARRAASRSTCCCPGPHADKRVSPAGQRGVLRPAGRLRRAGLDLPAVDDAREGDDGRRASPRSSGRRTSTGARWTTTRRSC